uniref:Uncharacterized protein n=1 Tax=Ralstonia pickettii TaxID=329 RepID=L0N170_RALPI|nr:hypothetical protein [Ralstonia pickettii]
MQRGAEFAGFRIHVGVGRTRLDVVDGDAARTQVACHALHQAQQRGLAHGIRAAAGERHAVGIGAADIDDAAALPHVRQCSFRGDEDGAHVDGERLVEVLQREALDRAEQQHAGVVDQDVELAELVCDVVDRTGERSGVGGVGLDGERAAAGRLHFSHQRIGRGRRLLVSEGDCRALARQAADDRRADAAGATGDKSGFSGEGGHEVLLNMRSW